MHLRIAVVCLTVGVLAGCSKDSPTAPSAVDFSGTWTGTMTEAPDRQGHFSTYPTKLTLVQTGDIISGTWTIRLGTSQPWREDPLSGSTDGSSLVLVLTIDKCVGATYGQRSGDALSMTGFGFDGRGIDHPGGSRAGCPTRPLTIALTRD